MGNDIKWQKSGFSGGGGEQCLKTTESNGQILFRESGNPELTITTSREKLAAFILGVKAGEFDHVN
ncbi:DUF397 domain-containing protein [Streptomyces lavenduligriseus]|nr:DUF397 domain-containing protein [Streptomyces lavenduligriseus]